MIARPLGRKLRKNFTLLTVRSNCAARRFSYSKVSTWVQGKTANIFYALICSG